MSVCLYVSICRIYPVALQHHSPQQSSRHPSSHYPQNWIAQLAPAASSSLQLPQSLEKALSAPLSPFHEPREPRREAPLAKYSFPHNHAVVRAKGPQASTFFFGNASQKGRMPFPGLSADIAMRAAARPPPLLRRRRHARGWRVQ